MHILDCTLRDGGNVLGNGFPRDLTLMILEGMLDNGVPLIEYGNAYGIGAMEADGKTAPLTDDEYLALSKPYQARGEIGMFIGVKNTTKANIAKAAEAGMKFLRVGANAGDGKAALDGIKLIRKYKMLPRFSMMKAYVLSAKDLACEAKMLEDVGLGAVTIMDSAGTMTPKEVGKYTAALVKAVNIPVGFHGHNNLGFSLANAVAAAEAGAATLDAGLLGMARSAGNLATELAAAVFQRMGQLSEINLLGLLRFLDDKLIPAMKAHGWTPPLYPLDIVLGYAGCHSNFLGAFKEVANETGVNLYTLIIEVSKQNRKNPTKAEMLSVAKTIEEHI